MLAAEPSRRRIAGRIVAAVLVVVAAMPAYLSLSPSWRPTAVRLASAAVVAIGCLRARRWVRGHLAAGAPSPLDALPAPAPEPVLDPRFLRLREDVIGSARNRRYFETVLWPRLSALAGGEIAMPAPPRRWKSRGPGRRALARIIADIEARP